MDVLQCRQELVDRLEFDLHRYASQIHLLDLSRPQGTKELNNFLCRWALMHKLNYAREVCLGAARRTRKSGFPYRGYVDFLVDGWLAIEIDSANKRWSLAKLEQASQRGFIAVWIRWKAPQKVKVPATVRLILLPTRTGRGRQAAASAFSCSAW